VEGKKGNLVIDGMNKKVDGELLFFYKYLRIKSLQVATLQ